MYIFIASNSDYVSEEINILVPPDSLTARTICTNFTILRDAILENTEDFSVQLFTMDAAVIIIRENSSVLLNDNSGIKVNSV